MTLIPVICENESCGHIWFMPSPFPFAQIGIMRNNRVGPCSECGQMGLMPDGDFVNGYLVMTNSRSNQRMLAALDLFTKRIREGQSVQQATDTVAETLDENDNSVFRRMIRVLIPENPQDLKAIIELVLMVMAFLKVSSLLNSQNQNTQVIAPPAVIKALDELLKRIEPVQESEASHGGKSDENK